VIRHASITTLLCDSTLRRVVIAEGELIEMGRTIRTVPAALYEAVATRDRGCRFPGCDRPAKWCDAHHVVPWWAGGHTGATNLVLLCRRHHRKIHSPGWHAKLLPDATFEVVAPSGRVLQTRPPRAGPLL
jgi:5-methylcytosine-specific restriction protein A